MMNRNPNNRFAAAATVLFLSACGGTGTDAPAVADDPGRQETGAAFRVMDGYLEPPDPVADRDGDGIPDGYDAFPDQGVVLASAYGASALAIERAWSEMPSGTIDDAATGQAPFLVSGSGLDDATGAPLLVFAGGIGPEVVVPERAGADTWRVMPPRHATGVFAVVGNRRSNAVPIQWLTRGAPKLLRTEYAVPTNSIVELSGISLSGVDRALLGTEQLEIVHVSDARVQLRLPDAPSSNRLQLFAGDTASNAVELDLRHEVRLMADAEIGVGAVSGRLRGERFSVQPAGSPVLSLPGARPQAFYFDTESAYSQLGAIAWPDESTTTISSESTLMTDLWVQGGALPFSGGMDWRDRRAMLQAALELPEAQAYIDGHRSWVRGEAPGWNRYAARQALMDAMRGAAGASTATQQALQIPPDELDGIVAFTVSAESSTKADFGSNSTVDLAPIDTPGNEFAQIEVAAHKETRTLLQICDYPPNTPEPADIWPSDLCMQNGTPVLASFAVFRPDTATFGKPYVPQTSDRVREHIDGPASTDTVAQGALYLTDNRGGAAFQPTLCRMQTCFVEVLTHGFGVGYKGAALSARERRVIKDLRLKWVVEEWIVPVLAEELGIPDLPACLSGEMYASIDFYQRIEQIVEDIRADRATHTVEEAKQLFDDVMSVWLHSILTGALSDDQNIVECVATEIATGEIESRLGGSTQFAEVLDDAKFVGGVLLTPEKFTFRVQYRAEVADVVADVANDGVTPLIDTVNGLYIDAAQTIPRRLTITGTWIADENTVSPAETFYPLVVFRDGAGNTESFLATGSHYVETGQQAFRRLEIPLTELVDNSGTDLNRLVPGMLDVSLQFVHAAFPGYPGNALPVPSPVRVLLVNKPQVLGFTPQAAGPGSIVVANGSSLSAFGARPTLALYTHQGSGAFDCASADTQSRVAIPPANVFPVQGDEEIRFALPDSVATEQFYYLCVSPSGSSAAETAASAIALLVLDPTIPNTGVVTFSDFGRVKDDAIRLSVLGNNGMPLVDNGVPLTFDIPNPLNGSRVRSISWDNNVFMAAGMNANSLLLECIDSGTDSTCTFGISVTNVDLDSLEDSGSVLIRSDAGKFAVGDKVEYRIVYP